MNREEKLLQLLKEADEACQRAIAEAATVGKNWMVEDASNARVQFEEIAEQIRSKTLAPSRGGGLGITRALSEWAPEYLYSAGDAVDQFYMANW